MLISQLDPSSIGTWVLVLAVVMSLLVSGANLLRGGKSTTSITGQPVQVELSEKFVTREAFNAHVQRVDRLEATLQTALHEIRDALTTNDEKAEDRSRRLHQRIDSLATAMSEKIGTLHGQLNPPRKS